jgi:hypothetical protein
MTWKIEQQGEGVWVVRKGTEHHWASNAADAVALMIALEAAGR